MVCVCVCCVCLCVALEEFGAVFHQRNNAVSEHANINLASSLNPFLPYTHNTPPPFTPHVAYNVNWRNIRSHAPPACLEHLKHNISRCSRGVMSKAETALCSQVRGPELQSHHHQ